eukprot:SAG31_NODE_37492_length_303_cov_7.916667_1_plen_35_part_10
MPQFYRPCTSLAQSDETTVDPSVRDASDQPLAHHR